MPGILYVVATPIGNLEDITLRALRILREVALVAAEDTRRTAKLLQHYSISTPTTSLHEHNEHAKTPGLIERLRSGDSIAVVSDAGTPGIADPGSRLVAAAHAAQIVVQPIPGASALATLVSAAGLGGDGFTFRGFAPARSVDRIKWLRAMAAAPVPIVFYEAPHRIRRTLADIQTELGERTIVLGRELTKLHEQLVIRPTSAWLADPPLEQGEFVLLVGPAPETPPRAAPDTSVVADMFGQVSKDAGGSRRDAIRETAARLGLRVKDVFQALEAQKSGED